MLKRVLVAVPAIALMLLAIFEDFSGGSIFLALMLVSAYVCVIEYTDMFSARLSPLMKAVSIIGTVLFVAGSYIATVVSQGFILLLAVPFFSIIALFFSELHNDDFKDTVAKSALAFLPVIYIGIGFGSMLYIKSLGLAGSYLLLYMMLTIWVTDSFALFCGKLFGRHNLGLAVSPNKTVEGTLGGLFFAVLAAVLFRLFLPPEHHGLPLFQWWFILPFTVMLSLLSQIGDLIESAMKRAAGVKDSSTLIPGHGGALDLLDAQIAVAPFVYIVSFCILV